MADEKQKKDAKKPRRKKRRRKKRRRKKPRKKAREKSAAKKAEKKGKAAEKAPAKKPHRKRGSRRNRPRSSSAPAPATCGSPPRKARLVANQVRGLQIERARALLEFSPRGAAQDIRKLIESAASNAENNHDLVADEMKVVEITVDEGPTLRRFRPRALGRATPINKRTSHIAVALSPEGEDY